MKELSKINQKTLEKIEKHFEVAVNEASTIIKKEFERDSLTIKDFEEITKNLSEKFIFNFQLKCGTSLLGKILQNNLLVLSEKE